MAAIAAMAIDRMNTVCGTKSVADSGWLSV
jgi:hypothetical protein